MSSLRFDGRVAIVTGAGNGLGREYALLLASRGASVVVNDLGGSFKGEGQSAKVADTVVDEIRKSGGKAVANYDSVEHGDRIVKTAVDAFGKVDIVICNAGILRDKTFAKMTDADWDSVHLTHLTGAYSVLRAAFPIMRDQQYGRIICITSTSGIYGNVGQANYASAKLAQAGLGLALSKEGASKNVLVNVVAPLAGSRMTETVWPKEMVEAIKPAYVAAFVATLCHESSKITGQIFECGAGWAAQVRWQRSAGHAVSTASGVITPEQMREALEKATNFDSGATYPTSPADSTAAVVEAMGKARAKL